MANQKSSRAPRVIVPRPERVRRPGPSGFGWLDARLHKQGWLERLAPEEIAVYAFLCLVADKQGVSWYRRDRIRQALGLGEDVLWRSLERLCSLDLVAYRPFGEHASDGFHQVLSLPPEGPPEVFPLLGKAHVSS
jgi:hypothetical protein